MLRSRGTSSLDDTRHKESNATTFITSLGRLEAFYRSHKTSLNKSAHVYTTGISLSVKVRKASRMGIKHAQTELSSFRKSNKSWPPYIYICVYVCVCVWEGILSCVTGLPVSPERRWCVSLEGGWDERVKEHSFWNWQGREFRGFRHEREGRRGIVWTRSSERKRRPRLERHQIKEVSWAKFQIFSHSLPELTAPYVSKWIICCTVRVSGDMTAKSVRNPMMRTAFYTVN